MKIDKNIPLPENPYRGQWALLEEVGDSVFFEHAEETTRIVTSANAWGKRRTPERKFKAFYQTRQGAFVSRYLSLQEIAGVRLWRVE